MRLLGEIRVRVSFLHAGCLMFRNAWENFRPMRSSRWLFSSTAWPTRRTQWNVCKTQPPRSTPLWIVDSIPVPQESNPAGTVTTKTRPIDIAVHQGTNKIEDSKARFRGNFFRFSSISLKLSKRTIDLTDTQIEKEDFSWIPYVVTWFFSDHILHTRKNHPIVGTYFGTLVVYLSRLFTCSLWTLNYWIRVFHDFSGWQKSSLREERFCQNHGTLRFCDVL